MVLNQQTNLYGIEPSKDSSYDAKTKGQKPYGFKYPLSNTDGGFFLKKSSGLELTISGLKQLLLTTRGERVMLPNFGTNLKNYLMEPLDQILLSQIRKEIVESVEAYATNVEISKIQIFPIDNIDMSGGHGMYIKLFCNIKENVDLSFEVKVRIS
jgi:phage baseplate assembly protein W